MAVIRDGGHGVVDRLGTGDRGILVCNLIGQIQFLSGKFSFCRANRLTPPHSKPLRYGPDDMDSGNF